MGRIVISTNASLDGVVQDPDGLEGFTRGGWFSRLVVDDLEAWSEHFSRDAQRAEALLLGRRSEAWFAERWNTRTGEWADKLNGMPKYVVSSTLEAPAWTNAKVLHGDVVDAITKVKEDVDGEIHVYGSYELAQTLIEHDLVDEVRLVVFPVVVGDGKHLFGETGEAKPMRLLDTRPIGDGLVYVAYELMH
jgi:dihydrofolate reductase